MASVKGKVTDEKIDMLVNKISDKFVSDVGWISDEVYQLAKTKTDPDSKKIVELCEIGRWDPAKKIYIKAPRFSTTVLQEAITSLLVAASSYNFADDELAVLLSTVYGEIRFGCQVYPSESEGGRFNDLEENATPDKVEEGFQGRGFAQTSTVANYQLLEQGFINDVTGERIPGMGDIYGIDLLNGLSKGDDIEELVHNPKISAHAAIFTFMYGIGSHSETIFNGLREQFTMQSGEPGGPYHIIQQVSANGVTPFPDYKNPDGSSRGVYRNTDGTMNLDMTRFFINPGQHGWVKNEVTNNIGLCKYFSVKGLV
jgi:hypothetical protein